MVRRLRLVLTAVLMIVTGVVVAGPAAAKDTGPVVFYQGLDLQLITGINQARAAVGSPPLSATYSVDIYAFYSGANDWACSGEPNPAGPDEVGFFGINPSGYVERVSAVAADSPDSEAILQNLLQDQALLDPAVVYAGLVSVSGGPQCPDTLRTVAVAADDVAWFGQLVSMVSLANGKFVTAEAGGAQPLIANRDAVGPWELFDVVQLSATDVSVRALANNRWVTAEAGGSQPLIANRTSVGQWEQFELRGPDGAAASASDSARVAGTSEAAKVAAAAKALSGR